ncbi:protein FAR1-RELATED SEQUENCE 4-like [Arachis stenosperma]|uniref:protein FAR1-RELATED SEQUENCE 4-like n=1 Tax=Arachis stenosperma TaxID=217475 RepID=UPI0025AB6799|nr:protein FAR1-RELATED SEQUENCE 4-like [Arachis stenosperma]
MAAAGSHRQLDFTEKDVRNYITREVRNISEEDDAKEFGKYLVRMKEKNQNFFFELNLEGDHCIKHAFWADARSRAAFEYFGDVVSFDTTYNTNSSLRHFVKQYDNCLASREQTEREFDAADFYTVILCATKSAIEAQFQHVSNSTFNKFVVTYDAVSRDVKCHCLLFESMGILCRHSLGVLSFERVDNVAPKYILKHWRKNIKRRHTHIKSSQDEPLLEPRSKRFDELVFRSHNICEFASESEELTGILHRTFDKVMADMEEY